MQSWSALQDYVRSKYKLQDDHEGWFSLVFTVGTERTQLISVRRFAAFDSEWIEFRSAVCREGQMDPKFALRKSAEMAVGSLVLSGDKYYVSYSVPLQTMQETEFEIPLHVLARTADQLEGTFTPGDEF